MEQLEESHCREEVCLFTKKRLTYYLKKKMKVLDL